MQRRPGYYKQIFWMKCKINVRNNKSKMILRFSITFSFAFIKWIESAIDQEKKRNEIKEPELPLRLFVDFLSIGQFFSSSFVKVLPLQSVFSLSLNGACKKGTHKNDIFKSLLRVFI